MLRRNLNYREKYRIIDPYLKQTPMQDVSIPNYREYDETQDNNEDIYRVNSNEDRNEIDNLRYRRTATEPLTAQVYEKFLTPLYFITAFFTAVLIFGPLLVRKGPNRGLVQACIMLSAFCMWIFWFTIYFGQMNPLMGPRLENTTVAWIAYKLGNPFNTTDDNSMK